MCATPAHHVKVSLVGRIIFRGEASARAHCQRFEKGECVREGGFRLVAA